jgi:hypothetical protein
MKRWERQELILAFNLYCQLPFGKIHSRNPVIMQAAKQLNRTPSSLAISNYKAWGEIIFRNPDKLNLNEIEERLRSSFDGREFFIASQIFIPEVFLFLHDRFTEDDHFFHEFHAVEFTPEQYTDSCDRSIKAFVAQVEHSIKNGWRLEMHRTTLRYMK